MSESVNPLSQTLTWKIKLLYDSECPLCMREINFLSKRDQNRGFVQFVDIAAENYSPEANAGIDYATAMGRIHAILPDGRVIKNVEVFRHVYEVLGLGWVYAITRIPLFGWIADRLYEVWADWRLALTGRPNLAVIVAERQQRSNCSSQGAIEGRCRIEQS